MESYCCNVLRSNAKCDLAEREILELQLGKGFKRIKVGEARQGKGKEKPLRYFFSLRFTSTGISQFCKSATGLRGKNEAREKDAKKKKRLKVHLLFVYM